MLYNQSIPPRMIYPSTICAAMQRDIDLLKRENPTQQHSEEYYNSLPQKTMLVVEYVTEMEIKFIDQPQVFYGELRGQVLPDEKLSVF